MLTGDEDQDNNFIGRELDNIRLRAKNQRNAVAMNKIADYYQRISEYSKAFACREEAKTFTNQPQTSSGSAFDSDFKRISNMIGTGASKYDIKLDLYTFRSRAKNLRDAVAMKKIADYYDEIGERTFAKECRDEAKTF